MDERDKIIKDLENRLYKCSIKNAKLMGKISHIDIFNEKIKNHTEYKNGQNLDINPFKNDFGYKFCKNLEIENKMKTATETLHQYVNTYGNSIESNIDCVLIAMNQYAKEAIQEVLKQYWLKNSEAIRNGGKLASIDLIAVEVMKNLK